MNLVVIIQILIISTLIAFYINRIYSEKNREIILSMVNIGIEAAFVVVGMILFTEYNSIYVCRIIGTGLFVYGYTLIYFTLGRLLNGHASNIIVSWPFTLGTLEFVTEVSIDAFLGNNIGNFFFNPPFEREWLYYIRYSISCLSLFRMQIIVYLLYRAALRRKHPDLYYYTRLKFGMYGYLLPAISTAIVFANLLLTIPFNEYFRLPLYVLSSRLGILGDIFLFISVLSEPFFNRIAYPVVVLIWYYRKRLATWLHSIYITLVERVHLHSTHLLADRIDYETTEAREYIWSHIPHSSPLTAYEEAHYVFEFLQCQQRFHEPGPYMRPPQECMTSTYNLIVAKYLLWWIIRHKLQVILTSFSRLVLSR